MGVPFLAICRAVLIHLVLFWGCSNALISIFSDSVDFSYSSYSKDSFFLIFLGLFCRFSTALLSGSVLSSTPYVGLLCLLRMHAINSCVGDA